MAVVDATLLTACGAENYGTERRWLSVAGIGESGTLWALSERDACNATGRKGCPDETSPCVPGLNSETDGAG